MAKDSNKNNDQINLPLGTTVEDGIDNYKYKETLKKVY